MKLIVFGGRAYADYGRAREEILLFIAEHIKESEEVIIVSGRCSDKKNGVLTWTTKEGIEVFGADGLGERFADEFGYAVDPHPADWKRYGKRGGPIRNRIMGPRGTHALELPGGIGTADMHQVCVDLRLVLKEVK